MRARLFLPALLPPLLLGLLLPAAPRAQSLEAELRWVAEAYAAAGFQGAVLFADGGEVVLAEAWGPADLDWGVDNAVDTRFRIGSLTKAFTAALVLDLWEEDLLELDAPITTYLPDYRADTGDRVTVHHLLRHTSGIPSYTDDPAFFRDAAHRRLPLDEFVVEHCSGDLLFEPGSEFAYNNSGYHLLGAIVEAVTGEPYDVALATRVLTPLGLEDTGYDWQERPVERRATGYARGPQGALREADFLDMSIPYSAGALYSTVHDLWRWERALDGDALLGEAARARFFEPGLDDYGYGWGVRAAEGSAGPMHRHGGGIHGFASMIARRPVADRAAVALSNLQSGSSWALVDALFAVAEGGRYGFPVLPEQAAALGTRGRVERVALGLGFTEGPAAVGREGVLFTDLHTSQVLSLPDDGPPEVLVADSGGINGLTVLPDGRLVGCRGGIGDVVAIDAASGDVTSLASSYEGRRFNKPNDLCADAAGGLWFSDPAFPGGPDEQPVEAVYHLAPDGAVTRTRASFEKGRRPNGVALSPDGATLYLASSRSDELLAYPVLGPGELGEPTVLAQVPGGGDGLAVDEDGRVLVAAPRERAVLAFDPDGTPAGRLDLPEGPANLAFTGGFRRELVITARTGVYRVRLAVGGPR